MIFHRTFFLACLFMLLVFPLTIVQPEVKAKPISFEHVKLTEYISTKYKINTNRAKEIILIAKEHSNESFPKFHDVLAIIAIESSFNIHAVSYAKARGLMQILYKKSSFDPKLNILDGTQLLKEYHTRLHSVDAAVQSYNVGIGNFKKGMRNLNYLRKFKQQKEEIKNADIL